MRILALAMATILAVVCLAACGGGEKEKGTPAAEGTGTAAAAAGTARPTATAAGTVRPTATAAATAAATRTPSAGAFAPGSLGDLNSYRYSMKMDLQGLESILAESMGSLTGQEPDATPGTTPETIHMEITGAFVAPDKAEAHMSISGLTDELAMTVIGDQEWMKWGDMVLGPSAFEGDLSEMNLAEAMWGSFSEEAGGLTCASEKKETVNGVPSRYCGIDQASFEQLFSLSSLFGGAGAVVGVGDIDELSLDLWLAEDGGWPVRLRAHVAGTDDSGKAMDAKLEMDITDVNSKIDINPPS
jgi:hypothetical protein